MTLHQIGHETLHALLHVDRSVVALIRALALRPGRVAHEYVSGRRKRYYGPFAFLVVCVAIASAAIAVSGFVAVKAEPPNAIADFLQHHVNLLIFFQVPILAAACRLLTPQGPFNYAEYLVLSAYASAMHILFVTVVYVGGWYVLKPSAAVAQIAYFALLPVWPLYLALACAQFLPGPKWLSAAKGVGACFITSALTYGTVFAASNAGQLFARGF